MKIRVLLLCHILTASITDDLAAAPMGTSLTYQGRLNDGAMPAAGIFDLRFTLYDAASAGSLVGGPITNASLAVSNGLFATQLDFGAAAFSGAARWLEIGVRTNGGVAFVTLDPLQPITPTPYAINAANLMNTGSVPLDIKVAGQRALRLEPNATSPNLIGGFGGNVVNNAVAGGTIAGGGTTAIDGTNGWNRVTDNFGTVGGGANNQAGNGDAALTNAENATVAGGLGNTASGSGSTVGGGYRNEASGISSVIGGGALNLALINDSVVGGGFGNAVSGRWSVIAGGYKNQNVGWLCNIGGGEANTTGIYADHSSIAGGGNNVIVGSFTLPVFGTISGAISTSSRPTSPTPPSAADSKTSFRPTRALRRFPVVTATSPAGSSP